MEERYGKTTDATVVDGRCEDGRWRIEDGTTASAILYLQSSILNAMTAGNSTKEQRQVS